MRQPESRLAITSPSSKRRELDGIGLRATWEVFRGTYSPLFQPPSDHRFGRFSLAVWSGLVFPSRFRETLDGHARHSKRSEQAGKPDSWHDLLFDRRPCLEFHPRAFHNLVRRIHCWLGCINRLPRLVWLLCRAQPASGDLRRQAFQAVRDQQWLLADWSFGFRGYSRGVAIDEASRGLSRVP